MDLFIHLFIFIFNVSLFILKLFLTSKTIFFIFNVFLLNFKIIKKYFYCFFVVALFS